MDVPDSGCKKCGNYADPGILGLYDDSPPKRLAGAFSMGWHAHPTSVYGPVERLCNPCYSDSLAVMLLMMKQLPEIRILGEIITAVSEDGKVLTRAYDAPAGLGINDPLDRKEAPIKIEQK